MIACMKSEIYETFKSLEKFWWGHGHTTKEVWFIMVLTSKLKKLCSHNTNNDHDSFFFTRDYDNIGSYYICIHPASAELGNHNDPFTMKMEKTYLLKNLYMSDN